MKPRGKLKTAAAVTASLGMICAATGCYQGVSTSEDVRILQTEYASSKRVAMLVERSDHAALSGTTVLEGEPGDVSPVY